jgi:hypothetical protein
MARTSTVRHHRTSRRTTSHDSRPKTTRPVADARRQPEPQRSTAERLGRTLDAAPDRVDIRDWFYRPTLITLPDMVVSCDSVPAILDQGREGACTGFALAAAIQFQLARRNLRRRVSPRMLYEMARHYDEWPGQDYEGSSARGAMIGWLRHGVCREEIWPMNRSGSKHLTPDVARDAMTTPGGAFYRVMHRQVRDLHAAIAESGILYCTLMVHSGWGNPSGKPVTITYVENGNLRQRTLPVIKRQGEADGGHAIALVGYTAEGFIVQNSWGESWGAGGFALLPYEDFMIHATDVWVAQLGVPVKADLWVEHEAADTAAGLQRASESIPLEHIRPYVIDVGNNGKLSDTGSYWTTKDDVRRLFDEIIPEATKDWKRRRVLLYLHGGLNDERAVASRIVAFKNVMLENEIYPLHIMWESGAWESLYSLIEDVFVEPDPRAGGVSEWLDKMRDRLVEAKDRTFELTVARPGTALWEEMKENARLASDRDDKDGALQIVADEVKRALSEIPARERRQWELHVVAHSAGSIVIAHALRLLAGAGLAFKSLQLMAPAITVELFKQTFLREINAGRCPHPTLYVLSDVGERDDNVGPWGAYGKSLLYLVSNAFERRRGVPILGMEKFVSADAGGDEADRALDALFKKKVDGHPSLVIAGATTNDPASTSRSETHGGFDNDEWTLNSILHRILGRVPNPKFGSRDLQYGTHRPSARALRYPELTGSM